MRVVITGATGNIGTSLVAALGEDDRVETIVGLARRVPDRQPPKTRWVPTDMADDELATRFRGADAVVHLAWMFQPTRDPLTTWRANVGGSLRVFEAVAQAGVPALVHASSIGAYAPGPQDTPVDETWPTHAIPTAAYGREKSYLERVLDAFEREHPDIRVVRMRPAFIFKRSSAAAQRRLFAGPLVAGMLARPGLIPFVPDVPGLHTQALHSHDAADAFRRVITGDARGAYNVAADPVVDAQRLAQLLDARVVRVPTRVLRAAVAAAWHLHAIPSSPTLVDLALSLPIMDTTRIRQELGWTPRHSSLEAIDEFLAGLRAGEGGDTPTLDSGAGGRLRWRELATGVGARDRTSGTR